MKPLIKIDHLTVAYDDSVVLDNACLEIYKNDFIGLIGPNGGGKTTFLKAVIGLLKPKSGIIQYNWDQQHNSHIGYLPQYSSIDKRFPITVYDVVSSGITKKSFLKTRFTKAEKQKINDAIIRLDLFKIKEKAIGEISGGQMQRALIARAIIDNPELLILDEPDTYVDSNFEKELYELLRDLNNDMAIIMVSHDIGMISSYVKTIACVNITLDYHKTNKISEELLQNYNCPIDLITHGKVPHRVLDDH